MPIAVSADHGDVHLDDLIDVAESIRDRLECRLIRKSGVGVFDLDQFKPQFAFFVG